MSAKKTPGDIYRMKCKGINGSYQGVNTGPRRFHYRFRVRCFYHVTGGNDNIAVATSVAAAVALVHGHMAHIDHMQRHHNVLSQRTCRMKYKDIDGCSLVTDTGSGMFHIRLHLRCPDPHAVLNEDASVSTPMTAILDTATSLLCNNVAMQQHSHHHCGYVYSRGTTRAIKHDGVPYIHPYSYNLYE